jgi:sugar/nucleoside kinase (ribokinase family)
MKRYDVYGIGNALVDTEFEVTNDFFAEHEVEKGLMTLVNDERQAYLIDKINTKRVKKQSGGSAANTVIAVKQFGGSSYYSCKVADDEYGHFYLKDLADSGVATNLDPKKLEAGTTGKCLVMVTPDADRTMNTYLGISSRLDPSVIDEEAIAQAKYVYIEGYLVTTEDGVAAMKETKALAEKHGTKVSITLSDPSIVEYFKPKFNEVIGSGVDLLFCNEEEALKFTGTDNLFVAREKLKYAAKKFAITLGKNGVMIFDGDTFIDIESFPVEAVDTNGAGDMFAGAFLASLTKGNSYAHAGKVASMAASKVVSKFGPRLDQSQVDQVVTDLLR